MSFFNNKKNRLALIVFLALSIWTALAIYRMYISYFVADPFNPDFSGTRAYGHNGAGAFQTFAVMTLIGYFVLTATLVPYFFSRHYWIRPLALQCVFGFWLILMGMVAMHSGGVQALHLFWTFGVNVIIFALLLTSGVWELVAYDRRRSQKNSTSIIEQSPPPLR